MYRVLVHVRHSFYLSVTSLLPERSAVLLEERIVLLVAGVLIPFGRMCNKWCYRSCGYGRLAFCAVPYTALVLIVFSSLLFLAGYSLM